VSFLRARQGSCAAQREQKNRLPARARTLHALRKRFNMAAVEPAPGLEVVRIPVLATNYIWLLRDPDTGTTAAVDPGDAAPVIAAIADSGWGRLDHCLITHHHADHVAGLPALRAAFPGLTVAGPAAEAARVPTGLDTPLEGGGKWSLGSVEFDAIHTPGHTRGHLCYHAPQASALFSGDTLFTCGSGLLFEGTAPEMWRSLSKLAALPPDTRVYCAHEYTQKNCEFAVKVDPANEALLARKAAVDAARAKGAPTVPSLLSVERATNPFLRAGEPALRAAVKAPAGAAPEAVFAALRTRKNGVVGAAVLAVSDELFFLGGGGLKINIHPRSTTHTSHNTPIHLNKTNTGVPVDAAAAAAGRAGAGDDVLE
jgi:hydroxyacylglutathione hydrolase